MNTFTDINEINSNAQYAPLGFETEFINRIEYMNTILLPPIDFRTPSPTAKIIDDKINEYKEKDTISYRTILIPTGYWKYRKVQRPFFWFEKIFNLTYLNNGIRNNRTQIKSLLNTIIDLKDYDKQNAIFLAKKRDIKIHKKDTKKKIIKKIMDSY